MGNEFNHIQSLPFDEGSYNRIQDIFPSADESKTAKKPSLPNEEVYRVMKDGLGQDRVLRNNLGIDESPAPPASSENVNFSASSLRSASGLFDPSRGAQLKQILERKRGN